MGCLGAPKAVAQAPLHEIDASSCSRFDRPGEPVSLVGLTDEVDPAHAPIPENDSERLLFRQVYETLVHIGCDLAIRPGLAATWQLDATGTNWIITLRPNARFSDGTAVTARDVIASWAHGGGATPHPEVARFVRAATALDDLTLSVSPRDGVRQDAAQPATPGFLAQPALAVARFAPESAWPLGTREVRPEGPAASSGGRTTITLVPAAIASTPDPSTTAPAGSRTHTAALQFLVSPRRDVRDLLDQGVDLLVTRDPAALAYANALAQFDAIPLPWLRSYVFLSRESAPGAILTPALRQKLADDAVPGEAQGSSFDWLQSWSRCTTNTPIDAGRNQSSQRVRASSGRIVFDATDSVARALAERITALISTGSADGNLMLDVLLPQFRSRKLQIAPLREPTLSPALDRGDDTGYIIAVDRPKDCAQITLLAERVPWATGNGVVPLVDTRLRAIVRRGRSQLAVEWDGSLLISSPGRSQ
jgi:hypothetical protein